MIVTVYCSLAWAAIAGSSYVWAAVPVLFCAFILSGCLNAGHDCVHKTHFGIGRWDRVAGALWCTPILVNFTIYRRQHLVHHRFPGIDGDSEQHVKFTDLYGYLVVQSGIGVWAAIFRRIVRTWRADFPISINNSTWVDAAQRDNIIIVVWLVACGLLTAWQPRMMLLAYWLPLLFYPAFVLFFSLAEHYDLTESERSWPRARNIRSNALVRFFQWHANYHAVHHRQPELPASALHSVHCAEVEAKDPLELSYLAFHFRLVCRLFRGRSIERDHDVWRRQ